ncbi:unnamed protein product [Hydatigera taeniaeformis]|uniref:Prefoldin subunit 4 n=1 Tax=Hydatigena taeniaeformis TaxID=6205 RepID=A0A0R3WYQ2_HYDTA|nr:unnamed protein product [Hydatigera taeniaeformis]
MDVEQVAAIVGDKVALLVDSDESAIEHAEVTFAERNTQLTLEIDALKEKLTTLEIVAGCLQYLAPAPGNPLDGFADAICGPGASFLFYFVVMLL